MPPTRPFDGFEWDRILSPIADPVLSHAGFALDLGRQTRESNVFGRLAPDGSRLVLVSGEEGIGKSAICSRAVERMRGAGRDPMHVHLGRSPLRLETVQALVECDRPVLILDALDERVVADRDARSTLSDLLRAVLGRRKAEVVLFGRPASLSGWFVSELSSVDGLEIDSLRVEQLSEDDARAAARYVGADGDAFVRAVANLNIGPVAARPLTLLPLLLQFRDHGTVPRTRREAFEVACRQLVTEVDRRRLDERPVASPEMLLPIAGHLAVVTALRGAQSIVDADVVPESSVSFNELLEWDEVVSGTSLRIRRRNLQEVLETGLFTAAGLGGFAWSSIAFRDYLAAEYLAASAQASRRLLSLAEAPGHPRRRFPTTLGPLVAWLCVFRGDAIGEVVDRDPFVLLDGDPPSLGSAVRERVVVAMLQAFEVERYVDVPAREQALVGVATADVAACLSPWLRREGRPRPARRLAIRIAFAGGLDAATPLLLERALDPLEDSQLRSWAALHVMKHGTSDQRRALLPLATVPDPGVDRETRGIALRAVYPEHVGTAQVLAILGDAEVEDGRFDVYRQFVLGDFPDRLPWNDVPMALAWAVSRWAHVDAIGRRALDGVMWRAWHCLEHDEVLHALVDAVWTLARGHGRDWLRMDVLERVDPVRTDATRRHRLLEALVRSEWAVDRYPALDLGRVLFREDFVWFVERASDAPLVIGKRWAELARAAHDADDRGQSDLVLEICGRESFLEAFAMWREGVPRDHWTAMEGVSQDRRERTTRERRALVTAGTASSGVMEQVATASKEPAGWPTAWAWLQRMSGAEQLHPVRVDVTTTPGWRSADDDLRSALGACALRWIASGPPDPLGPRDTLHAASAFRLAAVLGLAVPIESWARWSDLWTHPRAPFDIEEAQDKATLGRAYASARNELLAAALRRLRSEDEVLPLLDRLGLLWDTEVEAALDTAIEETSAERTIEVLGLMLRKGSAVGKKRVRTCFERWRRAKGTLHDAAQLATVWLTHEPAAWPEVWRRMALGSASALRLSFVSAAAHMHPMTRSNFLPGLDPRALGQLLEATTRDYPPEEDPEIPGMHTVEHREEIGQWRNRVREWLVGAGTPDAVQELVRLRHAFDDPRWLWEVERADERFRDVAFAAARPTVRQIRETLRGGDLVRSDEQLLDVVLDALRDVQVELTQAETPLVRFLWNETTPPSPKDESALSDWLKFRLAERLRARLVLVNREVEVRRGTQSDLYCQVLLQNGPETRTLTVPIEVKIRKWTRPQYAKAVRVQLVGQYLGADHRHGVLLVGWHVAEGYAPERGWRFGVADATAELATVVTESTPVGFHVALVVLDLTLGAAAPRTMAATPGRANAATPDTARRSHPARDGRERQ